MTERSYHNYIQEILEEQYGEDNVEHEVYLAETYRFVDFVVDTGIVTLAIEVEHSTDKAIREGMMSLLYASHERDWVPVIIHPPDGENKEEIEMMQSFAAYVPVEHRHQ